MAPSTRRDPCSLVFKCHDGRSPPHTRLAAEPCVARDVLLALFSSSAVTSLKVRRVAHGTRWCSGFARRTANVSAIMQWPDERLAALLLRVGVQPRYLHSLSLTAAAGGVWAVAALSILGGRVSAPLLPVQDTLSASRQDCPRPSSLPANLSHIEQTPRGYATQGRRAGARDAAWLQGRALGVAQPVSGCGCEPFVPLNVSACASSANAAQGLERKASLPPARHEEDAWKSVRDRLDLLLQYFGHCLRNIHAFDGASSGSSSSHPRAAGPDAKRKTSAKGNASIGTPSSAERRGNAQAVLDVVWGMAVMRPRVRTARFVLRSMPRGKQFSAHRKVARQLMPHWFPLSG